MIEMLFAGTASGQVGIGYRPIPAIYGRATVEGRPLPTIGAVGTGGLETASYYLKRMGYMPLEVESGNVLLKQTPFVNLMQEVKVGFGRTMTRLPEVFGVSRQTLYNWLDGETPKEAHQAKLVQLAEAARIFSALGFKPSSLSLDRTVSHGKSLLQLLSEGGNGQEVARKLVRISHHATESRAKLDDLLGGRRIRPDVADVGTPTFNERA
jgi:hypothetical protein